MNSLIFNEIYCFSSKSNQDKITKPAVKTHFSPLFLLIILIKTHQTKQSNCYSLKKTPNKHKT